MDGVDWQLFRTATLAFLRGADPYIVGTGLTQVYNPPWTYAMLAPLAVLPAEISRAAAFAVGFISFAYSAIRLGAPRWQVVMFLLSWPVMGCLATGNIDWLIISGLWMPPVWGLFFVLMKPQIGIGIAVYWAVEAWRTGGSDELVRRFAPVACAYLASFMIYGFWPARFIGMDAYPERVTGWPWVVPLGAYILYSSIRQRELGLSAVSSPLLAPYSSQFSYSALLAGLFQMPRVFLIAWLLLWSITGIRFLM